MNLHFKQSNMLLVHVDMDDLNLLKCNYCKQLIF